MTRTEQAASFLVDSPESLDETTDAFGHRDYAQAVAETLIDAPTPFTVGVFGPWGVGKSTIIGEVRRRLPPGVGFAYYDAWRYDGDALRRQLLRDVARQLGDAGHLKGFDADKDLEELEVTVQETKDGISFSWPRLLRSAIGGAVLGVIVFLFLRDRQGAALFSGHEPLSDAGVGAIVFVVGTLLTMVREPFQVTQRVLGTQRLEEPDRFAAKFEQLMACVQCERVVIAIDNLDRCSPDRAVEILSTIKTYLEPAMEPDSERRWLPPLRRDGREPKPAVFLIAADIDALRRHLLSKELEGAQQPEADAARYVDEYLRKFFSATLPIRASLDTEMRRYVGSQLAELVQAAKLDEGERKKLIEMAAAALGQNPRRVKQFANNLEIRLHLLAAREADGDGHKAMIRPPISDRPLEVAKLALIEEEWPAYFEALFVQPRSLAQWELAARGVGQLGPGVAGPAPQVPHDIHAGTEDWPKLAAFLRASDGVSIANPRPFLRLKQSETEVRLPGFEDFTDSIAAGDRDGAMTILAQADEEQRRGLEDELPDVFARELDERYIQGALRVVDLVISQQAIDEQIRATVLHAAISDPRIKTELPRLEPRLLLAAGQKLAAGDNRELQTLVADRLIASDAVEGEQRVIATALTSLGPELTPDARDHIRLASDEGTLPQRPDIVAIFAGFDETLVTEATTQRHLNQFADPNAQPSKPGQAASAMRIVLAGIRVHRDRQTAEAIASYIGTALNNEIAQPDGIEDTDLYVLAVRSIAPVAPEIVTAQAQSLVSSLPQIGVGAQAPFLRILGAALEAVSEEPQVAELAQQAIGNLFADPEGAITLLEQTGRELPVVFAPYVFQQLTGLLASGHPLRTRCASLLVDFAGTERADVAIADAAEAAISGRDFSWAAELARTHSASLQERGSALLALTLQQIPEIGIDGRSQALAAARELCQFSDAEQRVLLTSHLQEQILGADPANASLVIALAEAMAAQEDLAFELDTLVAAAAQHLIATPAEAFQPHLVGLVGAHIGILPIDVRERVERHFAEMLGRGEFLQPICEVLTAIPDADADARGRFARLLLDASANGALPERILILRAAQTLAANTAAQADVEGYVVRLASSEDGTDQEVYSALQG